MFYIYKDQPQVRKSLVTSIHFGYNNCSIIFVMRNKNHVAWEFTKDETADIAEAWEYLKGENREKETNRQD